ncbi:MAG: glycosyltransferase family 4 protein [Patescibacteria group bacterium]|nr:glycosyltransferase family 4 protein [Patescibacteria group bacterium]
MKIGINGYEAVVPRFGFDNKTGLPNRVGSGEFCYQLLLALSKIDKINEYSIFLPSKPTSDMPKASPKWKYVVFSSRKLWTLLGLSGKLVLGKNKIDVFFSPTHYLPFATSAPSIITILDVSYLYYPELFKKKDLYQLKLWGGYSIKKAKKIITISNSSKNDIIKMYGKKAEDVSVAYPGIKQELSFGQKELSMDELNKKFGIKGDYILFVGTLQPRKNLVRLVEAFSRLKDVRPKTDDLSPKSEILSLVVVGKKGWQFEDILNAPKKYGVENRVKFLDSVSDKELPSFYKNALCFVIPSLYEGFGLPVLEAMKYGCPVLTSSISSLPEAGGDAAMYFNPEDVFDIAEKINKVISDPSLRDEMVKKGYNQIKKFSWEKTAKETLKVLEEVGRKT